VDTSAAAMLVVEAMEGDRRESLIITLSKTE
jgi:hypothetical protein